MGGIFLNTKNSLEQHSQTCGACKKSQDQLEGPRAQRSLNWNQICFLEVWPGIFRLYRSAYLFEVHNFRKMPSRRMRTNFPEIWKFRYMNFGIVIRSKIMELIWNGSIGSMWAHIKTGRSHMAHDHFQTPPDPKKGFTNPKMAPRQVRRFDSNRLSPTGSYFICLGYSPG